MTAILTTEPAHRSPSRRIAANVGDPATELAAFAAVRLLTAGFLGERIADGHSSGIKFLTWSRPPVRGDSEGVVACAREDMEMEVKHLLKRGVPVGDEHIDSLARKRRSAQGARKPLADSEHVGGERRRDLRQAREVITRYHEHVARCDGADVHERNNLMVRVDDAVLLTVGHDRAEDASGHRPKDPTCPADTNGDTNRHGTESTQVDRTGPTDVLSPNSRGLSWTADTELEMP